MQANIAAIETAFRVWVGLTKITDRSNELYPRRVAYYNIVITSPAKKKQIIKTLIDR